MKQGSKVRVHVSKARLGKVHDTAVEVNANFGRILFTDTADGN